MTTETGDRASPSSGSARARRPSRRCSTPACVAAVVAAAELIAACLRAGGKLLVFGNGGSAADAQHIAAEFVGRFLLERAPLPALSLSDNASAVTAIGNDYGFDDVVRPPGARRSARPGDVALGDLDQRRTRRTCSRGVEAARALGIATIGLTGARRRRAARRRRRLHRRARRRDAAHPGGPHASSPTSCASWSSGDDRLSAVFLDRDGVINRKAPEGEYVTSWAEFAFLPGALEALRRARRARACRRRRHEPARHRPRPHDRGGPAGDPRAHARRGRPPPAGGSTPIYHCPHEGGCDCRKPGAGHVRARGARPRPRPGARPRWSAIARPTWRPRARSARCACSSGGHDEPMPEVDHVAADLPAPRAGCWITPRRAAPARAPRSGARRRPRPGAPRASPGRRRARTAGTAPRRCPASRRASRGAGSSGARTRAP